MLPAVAVLAAMCGLTAWRIGRQWPVTELEVWLHLLIDVAVLTWLLYLAGGSSNPFVSAYLVPIALAAVVLRPVPAVSITALCLAAYTVLLKFHVPLPQVHHGARSDFALHDIGMWVNFVLSAGMITAVVIALASSIRRRDRLIAHAREDALRNEHIVALGTLAAGAAHELSTPLSTVGMLADELSEALTDRPELQADLALLKQQLTQCKTSLSTLLARAGHGRGESASRIEVDTFLEQIIDRWRLLRPEVTLEVHLAAMTGTSFSADPALGQSLINLLNNAADATLAAGRQTIALAADVQDGQLRLEIRDQGEGIDQSLLAKAGRAIFSTKPDGSGLGLLLSNATLERLGGQLSLHPAPTGGTTTRIIIPMPLPGAPDATATGR